jgi:hypothetical protein
MRQIPLGPEASLGDFRRYPGCRLTITCAMCGWSKAYSPGRIIARLQELKAGGYSSPLSLVARRVQWPCPGCHRLRWRAGLAWPADLDAREAKRLANLYRN